MKTMNDLQNKIMNATNHPHMAYCFAIQMICGEKHCSTICPIKLEKVNRFCLSYNMLIGRLK